MHVLVKDANIQRLVGCTKNIAFASVIDSIFCAGPFFRNFGDLTIRNLLAFRMGPIFISATVLEAVAKYAFRVFSMIVAR